MVMTNSWLDVAQAMSAQHGYEYMIAEETNPPRALAPPSVPPLGLITVHHNAPVLPRTGAFSC